MINATVLAVIILIGGFLGFVGVFAWGWDFILGVTYGVLLFGLIGSMSPTVRSALVRWDDKIDDEGLWKKVRQ